MEPTYMPTKHADADAVMPCRVCGCHHADQDQRLPQSLWATLVGRVDDFIKLVRQVDDQRDQRAVAREPGEPPEPSIASDGHACPRHTERRCNCADDSCADDDIGIVAGREPVRSPTPNFLGRFRCPVNGKLCSVHSCRTWCESSGTGPEADADRRYAEAGKYR
jgi:hypothetical protein